MWPNARMPDGELRELRFRNLVVPVRFLAAARGTWTPSDPVREVRLICLHSAECGEVPVAAEALQTWAAGNAHPKGASWHFAVDSDSITQSVEIHNMAWHAGPINGCSIGIEQAGRAAQTYEQWTDAYSMAMLDRTAQLIALIAAWYDLPIEHVMNPKVPNCKGVCTHADVTRAWDTRGGHTDPGNAYPMDIVLANARAVLLEAAS
jgi:N-acetyl-anhydromuramyl-L-alanine amidase AmpD